MQWTAWQNLPTMPSSPNWWPSSKACKPHLWPVALGAFSMYFKQCIALPHDAIVGFCRLQRFQYINGQLGSFDKDTLKQVDDACKEIARNCELLTIIKADLHSILKRIRCFQPAP